MILSSLVSMVAAGSMIPVELRCNALDNPIGIDSAQPEFSWQSQAAKLGLKNLGQTSYRILVSNSLKTLAKNTGDLWDSGTVQGRTCFGVHYAGKPLRSGQRAYWKVAVADQNGAIQWSQPAWFQIGLLQSGDWKSKWITAKIPDNTSDSLESAKWIWRPGESFGATKSGTIRLERTIKLPSASPIASASVVITADDRFTLRVNGTQVAESDSGPDAWRRLRIVALSQLKAGENIVEIEAENLDNSYAGVIAKFRVTYQNGDQTTFVTDRYWSDETGIPAQEFGEHGVRPWGTVTEKTGRPATLYRKEFVLKRAPLRATLFATALGLVDMHLNGRRVSDELFTPGWTDYNKRIYYRAYDVTKLVNKGNNCVGAEVGDGWFSGYIGWQIVRDHYGTQPRLRAQLELEYEDGTKETIGTDRTWMSMPSPTFEQDFLMGEGFDAAKYESDWCRAGSSSGGSTPAEETTGTGAPLEAFPAQPVRAYETRKPASINPLPNGDFVLDFGQNLAGFAQVHFAGMPGQKLTLKYVEVLNPDGTPYTANLRGARALDTYICSGRAITWQPRFTFHGFRYLVVSGLSTPPKPNEIQAVAISSATPETGTFECSDPMLNRLALNAWWTQKMNFVDIPTDCPQRDERLGWTGDAQAYIRTAAYFSDVQAFFDKWLITLDDAQSPNGDYPKVAPIAVGGPDGGPAWADAGVICPWAIYEVYGDKELLARHYPNMKRFVEFTKARSKPDRLPPDSFHCFGDWLQINANTPNDVIYSAYFAGSAQIVAKAARVLGKPAEAAEFERLSDEIKVSFNRAYVSPDGKVRGETQCSYVLALAFDLLSPELAEKAAGHLVADIEARGGHLSTGFVGTRDLMHVLTKIGRNDVAFRLLHNKTFPSWGFEIENGATTIWERWDGWTPERGFQDPGMNSFAHYAYGAVLQWVFENIGGIRSLEPGFTQIRIAPAIDPRLTWAKTTYHSKMGPIVTHWKVKGQKLTLEVEVPPNVTAKVEVPTRTGIPDIHEVGSGKWTFAAAWPEKE